MITETTTQTQKIKPESPQYLRTSLAAAMTLKLQPGRFYRDAKLYCINLLLMYKEGCAANCAYCGLSRERKGEWEKNSFIRVTWPSYPLDEIINRMKTYRQEIKRVCISMITHPKAVQDTITVTKKIKENVDILISALISPTIMKREDLIKLKEAGVDHIGVAIDAATPQLFEKYRGKTVKGPHRWEKYWEIVKASAEIFKNATGIHLIVGLGETEKEIISVIQKAQDMGVDTHLFSFYPEENSQMANHPPPPLDQYRRVQLARYLINNNIKTIKDMKFNEEGQLTEINITQKELDQIVNTGKPFMTSGCPDENGEVACNRPYANERPSETIRNYPFYPNEEDIKTIKTQFKIKCTG